MQTVNVTYTAYEAGTRNVLSEGVMPVQTNSSITAGEIVRAMFSGMDVVIRDTRTVF